MGSKNPVRLHFIHGNSSLTKRLFYCFRSRKQNSGMEKTVESLAGYVEHIIYRNADNGYTVLNLVSGEDEITCVGIFSAIAEEKILRHRGVHGTSDLWAAV